MYIYICESLYILSINLYTYLHFFCKQLTLASDQSESFYHTLSLTTFYFFFLNQTSALWSSDLLQVSSYKHFSCPL